jgi:hypothetical protein
MVVSGILAIASYVLRTRYMELKQFAKDFVAAIDDDKVSEEEFLKLKDDFTKFIAGK